MKKLLLAVAVSSMAVGSVQPDEILDDPVLEARAREISKGLRCLVCRNENIDDSNADLARDLRLEVREQLTEGATNDEVTAFLVDKYGEYVLLRPQAKGSNWVLYAAGPGMLILAVLGGLLYLRRRSQGSTTSEAALSADETERLDEIMKR